ncbi:AAA family ATPase [Marinobacter nauticus]|uniref:DUF3696 domain-containing protein n=1 Tax=Marinobacter nauticus (strain ATCC 700491 / DSM 11845 / VT8) TaxID=351348 RepID=A1U0M6_MARN8|nr:DUF3696 domain-containing protein [Marinobacter nauticus]ABM18545.1 conserved hypothetical protein [Marinobacter nauticus VT8]
MITQINIENFKCFSKKNMPVGALTMLTGFNAAGKSTALQALLLISQMVSGRHGDVSAALNGELVRMGTPGDVLRSDGSKEIKIGIETVEQKIQWTLVPSINLNNSLDLKDIHWASPNGVGDLTNISCNTSFNGLTPNEAPSDLSNLANEISDLIFISAVRMGTQDVYPSPTEPSPIRANVGMRGDYAPWWYEQHLDYEIDQKRVHSSEKALTLRRQLNAWLDQLFPGAEANAQKLPNTDLIQLLFRNSKTDVWRKPANIGYGLTYAFPILVAGLLARPGQLLIIDSPEAHLHPLGQSNMGKFLAKIAASGVQVLVETHSDHVLNGARLAVKSRVIDSRDVGILFFNRPPQKDGDPEHIIAPSIDKEGNLSDWPLGFFDQAENDLAVLADWG